MARSRRRRLVGGGVRSALGQIVVRRGPGHGGGPDAGDGSAAASHVIGGRRRGWPAPCYTTPVPRRCGYRGWTCMSPPGSGCCWGRAASRVWALRGRGPADIGTDSGAREGLCAAMVCTSKHMVAFFSSALRTKCTVARASNPASRDALGVQSPPTDTTYTVVVENGPPPSPLTEGSETSGTLIPASRTGSERLAPGSEPGSPRSLEEALAESTQANVILARHPEGRSVPPEQKWLFLSISGRLTDVRQLFPPFLAFLLDMRLTSCGSRPRIMGLIPCRPRGRDEQHGARAVTRCPARKALQDTAQRSGRWDAVGTRGGTKLCAPGTSPMRSSTKAEVNSDGETQSHTLGTDRGHVRHNLVGVSKKSLLYCFGCRVD